MQRVFITVDEERICLGTVNDILSLSGSESDFDGIDDERPFSRRQWDTVTAIANVFTGLIGDLACDPEESNAKEILLEVY